MATTINADTEIGGAIVTGDTSGILSLQSAGNTLVTLSGGSVAVAAGLTADSASITGAVAAASATITNGLTAAGLSYPTADATARKAISTNGSGTLSFGGYTSLNPIVIKENTTGVAGNVYYLDSAGITLTLPATPDSGDIVGVSDISGGITSVIARNGNKIMSNDSDLTLDVAYVRTTLIYTGSTVGWALT